MSMSTGSTTTSPLQASHQRAARETRRHRQGASASLGCIFWLTSRRRSSLLTCWRLPRALRHPSLSSVLDEGRGILGFAYNGNRWAGLLGASDFSGLSLRSGKCQQHLYFFCFSSCLADGSIKQSINAGSRAVHQSSSQIDPSVGSQAINPSLRRSLRRSRGQAVNP